MDCKDLMIGDWVKVEEPTETVKARVLGVHKDGVINYEVFYSCVRATGQIHTDYVSPIPLTEEILVNNGFEKAYTKVHGIMVDENLWFGHIGADYVELRLEGNVAIWKDYDEKADGLYSNYLFPLPTSVHELQHLFRLCGVEKELVID